MKLWHAASGKPLLTLRGHDGPVGWLAFSPDGRRLASVSLDQALKLWELESGQEVLTLKPAGVNLAFSPDGNRLLASGLDGMLRIFGARPLGDD